MRFILLCIILLSLSDVKCTIITSYEDLVNRKPEVVDMELDRSQFRTMTNYIDGVEIKEYLFSPKYLERFAPVFGMFDFPDYIDIHWGNENMAVTILTICKIPPIDGIITISVQDADILKNWSTPKGE